MPLMPLPLDGPPGRGRGRAGRWASPLAHARPHPAGAHSSPCAAQDGHWVHTGHIAAGRDGTHSPPGQRSRSRESCSRKDVPAPRLAMVSVALASPGTEGAAGPVGWEGAWNEAGWRKELCRHRHRRLQQQHVLLPSAAASHPQPRCSTDTSAPGSARRCSVWGPWAQPATGLAPCTLAPGTTPRHAWPQAQAELISGIFSRFRAEICGFREGECWGFGPQS